MKKPADCIGRMARVVTAGYQKIERVIVGGYRKIERSAVRSFEKVTGKCVEVLFAKEGETAREAKKRLWGESRP